jgi:hypothetical protein
MEALSITLVEGKQSYLPETFDDLAALRAAYGKPKVAKRDLDTAQLLLNAQSIRIEIRKVA